MLYPETALRKDKRTASQSPVMQHRHFATIAAIIRDIPEDQRPPIAQKFADKLRSTNSNFDALRFYRACMQ